VGPGSYDPIDVHHKRSPSPFISRLVNKPYNSSSSDVLNLFKEIGPHKDEAKIVPAIIEQSYKHRSVNDVVENNR